MKDFNSYLNQGNRGERPQEGVGEQYGGIDIATVLNALAGKYEGAKEDEIISAIVSEVDKGRKNGTLTDADLISFRDTVAPMLDEKQRKRLNKIVKYLLNK